MSLRAKDVAEEANGVLNGEDVVGVKLDLAVEEEEFEGWKLT